MGDEDKNTNTAYQTYPGASILQIRLETSQLLNVIESYLSGKRTILIEEDNDIKEKVLKIGDPKLNEVGVQTIMQRITLIFTPSVVQGNFTLEMYQREIGMVRESLTGTMMDNLYRWGIDEKDYTEIIDSIMTPIKAYLSRLIGNKERESYAATIKTVESSIEPRKSRIPFLS